MLRHLYLVLKIHGNGEQSGILISFPWEMNYLPCGDWNSRYPGSNVRYLGSF